MMSEKEWYLNISDGLYFVEIVGNNGSDTEDVSCVQALALMHGQSLESVLSPDFNYEP